MTKVRGFEVAKGFEEKEINLPVQSTKASAGFDFECAEDTTIQPLWKQIWSNWKNGVLAVHEEDEKKIVKPKLVPTGIKAYMQDDEVLYLYNRSSNPLKKFLLLANGVGVIDSDYYSNPDNDGHIMFQFINFGLFPKTLKKGERIGQGIFAKFLKADKGKARFADTEREGGHGSTN